MVTWKCEGCDEEKPLAEFGRRGNLCSECRPKSKRAAGNKPGYYRSASYRARQRERYTKLRLEVLAMLGGACRCCGESHPDFLVIDHVHGRRPEERRIGGYKLYRLIQRDERERARVQVLCHNCNAAKELPGGCPHQRTLRVVSGG